MTPLGWKTKTNPIHPDLLDTILIVMIALCFVVGLLGIWLSIENGLKQPNDIVAVEDNGNDRT